VSINVLAVGGWIFDPVKMASNGAELQLMKIVHNIKLGKYDEFAWNKMKNLLKYLRRMFWLSQ
jgi:hypothetical protein